MKELFGKAIDVLEHAIDLRIKRNALLASNIANVDTPAYRARDIPFKKIMAEYMEGPAKSSVSMQCTRTGHIVSSVGQGANLDVPGASMMATDPRHFVAGSGGPGDLHVVQSVETGTPNDVDLDQEMAKLAANNLQYQVTVQSLIKELELIRVAITEGGRV